MKPIVPTNLGTLLLGVIPSIVLLIRHTSCAAMLAGLERVGYGLATRIDFDNRQP